MRISVHILRCLQFFTAAIPVLICYPSSHIWLEPENLTVLTKKCFKKPNGWCKKVFVRIFIRPESFLYLELCVELLNSDVETYNYEIHFYSLNKKQDGGKRHRQTRPCKDNKHISKTSRAHILRNIADCITPEPLSPALLYNKWKREKVLSYCWVQLLPLYFVNVIWSSFCFFCTELEF